MFTFLDIGEMTLLMQDTTEMTLETKNFPLVADPSGHPLTLGVWMINFWLMNSQLRDTVLVYQEVKAKAWRLVDLERSDVPFVRLLPPLLLGPRRHLHGSSVDMSLCWANMKCCKLVTMSYTRRGIGLNVVVMSLAGWF